MAAPTTSLPEQFGSERNWDYRLCWVRDATLTLLAMMNAGIYDEAAAWRDWLQRAVAGSPDEMQIMYGLMGERRLTEWEVDWLPGYANSKPVRIGNAAHEQFQLDVYGELMDAFEQSRKGGLAATEEGWELQRALVDHVAMVWDKPDQGIWESARAAAPFRLLQGHGLGRLRPCRERRPGARSQGARSKQWRSLRDRISSRGLRQGLRRRAQHLPRRLWQRRSRRQPAAAGADRLREARRSALVGTVEAIERELLVDGFVRRYHTHECR